MIIKIYSDLESFKTLHFKPGLNILLAERHESSGVRDTRNGTGKTSVIELLHFLVQKNRDNNDDFHKEPLLGRSFGATFKQTGDIFDISKKSSNNKDEVFLNQEAIAVKPLRNTLSLKWFGLTSDISDQPYSPKFGSLFSYFVRKARNGAFQNAQMISSKQQAWDSQINLSYLLGFDWTLIQKLQEFKVEKKSVDNLLKMIKDGYFSKGPLDLNKMQSELDLLESEAERKRKEISSVKVLDGYKTYEDAANDLTNQIRVLNEENLADLDLQEDISSALKEVEDVNVSNIRAVYEEVKIYFTPLVNERFDNVVTFHKQLAENRQQQLSGELNKAKQRVTSRRQKIDQLQAKLKTILDILRSGIALDRMALLQSNLNILDSKIGDLRIQIPRLRDADQEHRRLQRKIIDQVELIDQDVQAREEARKFAITEFAEISKYLYDEPGQLTLGGTPKEGGFLIDIDIPAKKSGGKNLMQVFCFDWLLVETSKRQNRFPGFLVHDSHIFDGVDGRQIGRALSFAQQKCDELGVQYIVAMNSDDLQKIKQEEEASGKKIFDPTDFIMETRLSDDERGGLFGFRF